MEPVRQLSIFFNLDYLDVYKPFSKVFRLAYDRARKDIENIKAI